MILRRLRPLRSQRGFSLVELAITVAIISILVLFAIPLYLNVLARGRVITAGKDVREIASAVAAYRQRTGKLPAALADLATPALVSGACVGPFLSPIPAPPKDGGWPAAYAYTTKGETFTVSASGDRTTVSAP